MDKYYEETYPKRKKRYEGEKEKDIAPKASKFVREKIGDPLSDFAGKVIPEGKPHTWEKADRAARKEVLGYKKGGSVKSSVSKRADGCAARGKTRGRMV